jgi:hypothetical protein
VFLLAALVSTALAVLPVQPEGMRERVTAQVEAAKARLALTDAQREQATPIIRGGIERRMQILKKHGLVGDDGRPTGEKPSLRDVRGIRRAFDDVHDDVVAQLEPILTPQQMDEYRKIQQEAKDALLEKARERGRN